VPADRRRIVGRAGEDAVVAWYESRGYDILERNWRVRSGEIDVIARAGATLVFCEVKTRRGDAFGPPVESVTLRKQRRLRLLARHWFADGNLRAASVRFDVASVVPDGRGGWTVDVLEGAF
jgi:putative endonuclease